MATSFALGSERSALPPEIAGELRDALGRRQKELPPRWLAAVDADALRDGRPLPTHENESLERELGLALLRDQLPDARPRGVVCVQPSASNVNVTLADALGQRGSVTSIGAAELDSKLAAEMVERIASNSHCESSAAVVCDCTIELPLPDRFPRPRVYLCLGNVLGATTAVGSVRLLRVLRTTMTPGDSLVLGLEGRHGAGAHTLSDEEYDISAWRHLGALGAVNAAVGGAFDLSHFEFRTTVDAENSRNETHLVARRAHEVEVPGVGAVRLRKGESIRTSVRCVLERNRVAAMLTGVGLALRTWNSDAEGRYVVALAAPAV